MRNIGIFKSNEKFLCDDFLIELICFIYSKGNLFSRGNLLIRVNNVWQVVNIGDIEYEDIYFSTLKGSWYNGLTIPQLLRIVGEENYCLIRL